MASKWKVVPLPTKKEVPPLDCAHSRLLRVSVFDVSGGHYLRAERVPCEWCADTQGKDVLLAYPSLYKRQCRDEAVSFANPITAKPCRFGKRCRFIHFCHDAKIRKFLLHVCKKPAKVALQDEKDADELDEDGDELEAKEEVLHEARDTLILHENVQDELSSIRHALGELVTPCQLLLIAVSSHTAFPKRLRLSSFRCEQHADMILDCMSNIPLSQQLSEYFDTLDQSEMTRADQALLCLHHLRNVLEIMKFSSPAIPLPPSSFTLLFESAVANSTTQSLDATQAVVRWLESSLHAFQGLLLDGANGAPVLEAIQASCDAARHHLEDSVQP